MNNNLSTKDLPQKTISVIVILLLLIGSVWVFLPFVAAWAEYITQLVENWNQGIVVFGGVGEAADELDDLKVKDFRYPYGFGFRYIFDE